MKCMPIEVGSTGFVGYSLHRAISTLSITGGARSRIKRLLPEYRRGLINHGQVNWERVYDGYINDNVFK